MKFHVHAFYYVTARFTFFFNFWTNIFVRTTYNASSPVDRNNIKNSVLVLVAYTSGLLFSHVEISGSYKRQMGDPVLLVS